jgi:hypothetical protein
MECIRAIYLCSRLKTNDLEWLSDLAEGVRTPTIVQEIYSRYHRPFRSLGSPNLYPVGLPMKKSKRNVKQRNDFTTAVIIFVKVLL